MAASVNVKSGNASLHLDTSAWEAAMQMLGDRAPRAIARGINRTLGTARTALARAIAKDMGLPVGRARDEITIRKASASQPVGQLVSQGRRLPVSYFKPSGPQPSRGKGRGASWVMHGKRVRERSAFIATVGVGGHKGVFVRVAKEKGGGRKKSAGAWSKNLPIVELKGPSIAHVFGLLAPASLDETQDTLTKNVQHEIEFELSKLKA